jgi:hypothetical protein
MYRRDEPHSCDTLKIDVCGPLHITDASNASRPSLRQVNCIYPKMLLSCVAHILSGNFSVLGTRVKVKMVANVCKLHRLRCLPSVYHIDFSFPSPFLSWGRPPPPPPPPPKRQRATEKRILCDKRKAIILSDEVYKH